MYIHIGGNAMSDARLDTKVRREQIAEAAMSLVANHGLRRLSMASVARRVGLVPSGIYRHFKSKDALIDAILDRVEQRLLGNVEAARSTSDNPLEQLKDILLRHVRFIREGRAIPRIILSDDAHSGRPQRQKRILKIIAAYTGAIGEIIDQGQKQGRIKADLDVHTLVMMLLGIAVPAGILWHLTDGGFDVTRHAQKAWKLLYPAIAIDTTNPISQTGDD
jgi:AcrR family transcriptional regulator